MPSVGRIGVSGYRRRNSPARNRIALVVKARYALGSSRWDRLGELVVLALPVMGQKVSRIEDEVGVRDAPRASSRLLLSRA